MTPPLCIVVKGFPRISETFITSELEALQDYGLKFSMASLRRRQTESENVSHRVSSAVNYLPEYLHEEPWRVGRCFRAARLQPGFATAWRSFRADLRRDFSRNRVRRFGQACALAAELPPETRHLHAHFIHTPASVARYAAAIRDISFSVSAHAKDIWTTPDWDLAEKLKDATFVCTCNEAGAARLTGFAAGRPPALWPHMLADVAPVVRTERREGPIRLLTVARAVPKKGLTVLLDAMARLPRSPAWTWTHIGGGPELPALKAAAADHPYKERLSFWGARPHGDVLAALCAHDIFVLTAQIAGDGDRDGRPNAVIEAMSAGLACVVTGAGGLLEIAKPDAAVIVPPDAAGIANGLAALLSAPEKVAHMGECGKAHAAALREEGRSAFDELARALRKASGQ